MLSSIFAVSVYNWFVLADLSSEYQRPQEELFPVRVLLFEGKR